MGKHKHIYVTALLGKMGKQILYIQQLRYHRSSLN